MRLIFVRHGEPDYATDTLTENGRREADALRDRTKHWENIDRVFTSPLGRARLTAEPTLKAWGREAEVLPWLKEFSFPIIDPSTGEKHGPWDLQPEFFTEQTLLYDKDRWFEAPIYKTNPDIEKGAKEVTDGIDGILREYGYFRHGNYYDFVNPDGTVLPAEKEDILLHGVQEPPVRDRDDEKTVAFFCHFGVTALILSHLIGVSPVLLWQGTCVPPTGITVVNAEKRLHNKAYFRIQCMGDCSHLLKEGVPISGYASFAPLWQK